MNQFSRMLIAGILFFVSTAVAHAQASGEARISNVRLLLTDLDPNDGIAPSITFSPDSPAPTVGWGIYDQHTGNATGDYRLSNTPLGPISISHSSSELPHTRSDLEAGVSGPALADLTLWAKASMADTVGINQSNAYALTGNVLFVLSPHTRVTLSADLSVRSSAGPVAGPGQYAVGYASANMGLYSSRDNVWKDIPLYHNAVHGEDRGPGWDATYSLAFDNTLASSGDYVLGLNVGASAYTRVAIPAPVPEPVSITMLLAGLGLLGARLTRRKNM